MLFITLRCVDQRGDCVPQRSCNGAADDSWRGHRRRKLSTRLDGKSYGETADWGKAVAADRNIKGRTGGAAVIEDAALRGRSEELNDGRIPTPANLF